MNLRRPAIAFALLPSLIAAFLGACATTVSAQPAADDCGLLTLAERWQKAWPDDPGMQAQMAQILRLGDTYPRCVGGRTHPDFKAEIDGETVFSAADIVRIIPYSNSGLSAGGDGGVSIELSPEGATPLADFSRANIGQVMKLSRANGVVLMEPIIPEAIRLCSAHGIYSICLRPRPAHDPRYGLRQDRRREIGSGSNKSRRCSSHLAPHFRWGHRPWWAAGSSSRRSRIDCKQVADGVVIEVQAVVASGTPLSSVSVAAVAVSSCVALPNSVALPVVIPTPIVVVSEAGVIGVDDASVIEIAVGDHKTRVSGQ